VLADERATTAACFLRRAVAHYRAYGIRVERVMTDNGSCYRAVIHALACTSLRIKHMRTQPYGPPTNGKAERFIRTLLGGWAYGAIYRNSEERRLALAGWLDFYNRRRPHGSLAHQPPLQRVGGLGRRTAGESHEGRTLRALPGLEARRGITAKEARWILVGVTADGRFQRAIQRRPWW